ncbi:MAG: hypothetical protein R3B09_02335 [Nannocystaceae bacterium]
MAENNGVKAAAAADAAVTANMMTYFKEALRAIEGVNRKDVADWLSKFSSFEAMVDGVRTKLQGTWQDSLALMASSLAGLFLGHTVGKKLPAGGGLPIPFVSLFGLVGVIPGLWMKQPLVIRNVFTLGGALFAAGAALGAKSVGA